MVSPSASASTTIPAGTAEVVIITLIDERISSAYLERIKHNRDDYAKRYGESGSVLPFIQLIDND